MSATAGPFSPAAGVPFIAGSPAASGGATRYTNAVVVNLSPFELVVATGVGSTTGLVDPFTRNLIPLDPQAGQQLQITPLTLPVLQIPGAVASIYVVFYGQQEDVPGQFPSPIISSPQTITYGPSGLLLGGQGSIGGANPNTSFVVGLSTLPGIYRSLRLYLTPRNSSAPQMVSIVKTIGATVVEGYTVLLTVVAGTNYGNGSPPPFVLPLEPLGALAGEEVTVSLIGTGPGALYQVVADEAPALEVSAPFPWYQGIEDPPVAAASTGGILTNGPSVAVLAAPPSGLSWKLFSWDCNNVGGLAGSVYLGTATAIISEARFTTAPPQGMSGIELNTRVTVAVTTAADAGGAPTARIELRYALSP